jgi:ketosteroid isomerase-like protein
MLRLLLVTLLLATSCSSRTDAQQIEKQLDLYASYVRAANYFGIASLFTEDGILEPAIKGTKAIQQHLSDTGKLKVVEYSLNPDPPVITNNTATQSIVYQQRLRTPQGSTVEINGRLTLAWQRGPSGRWLISRMSTSSAQQP